MIQSQVEKVIEIYKRSSGGEKSNAERILRKYCTENKLNFEEMISGIKKKSDIKRNPYEPPRYTDRHQAYNEDIVSAFNKKQSEIKRQAEKINSQYIDFFGHVWSGHHIQSLTYRVRVELFGRDPIA